MGKALAGLPGTGFFDITCFGVSGATEKEHIGVMEKSPHTDPYCLTDAPGEKARVALFGPAVGCQRVWGEKHGASGRGGCFGPRGGALFVGVKPFQLFAKRVARLGGNASRKLADRGLFTAASGCDFDLRHAMGNQLCNEVFPVHAATITVVRYFSKRIFVSGFQ
jgi:hypothetical protein